MEKILKYHTWTNKIPIRKAIVDDVKRYQPNIIKIFALEEFEADIDWQKFYENELKLIISDKTRIEIFLGSTIDHVKYKNSNNIIFYSWPYFFLFYTFCTDVMQSHTYHPDLKIKKLFISLNDRPRYHRCLLIDLSVKNSLLNIGNVSWNNRPPNNQYQWKWWRSPKVMKLTDEYSKTFFQYKLPKEWNESFVNLVSETSVDTEFITEKTWIPVLCKKPFLVQSTSGYYKYFQSLGFKVYDEIFDYDFDNIEDLESRTQLILDNLKNISNKDYQMLYNMIQSKIEHNYNRAIELIQDKNIIPKFMIEDDFAREKYFGFIEQSNSLFNEKYSS